MPSKGGVRGTVGSLSRFPEVRLKRYKNKCRGYNNDKFFGNIGKNPN